MVSLPCLFHINVHLNQAPLLEESKESSNQANISWVQAWVSLLFFTFENNILYLVDLDSESSLEPVQIFQPRVRCTLD